MGCSGISWTICKSFPPCSRQTTTPAPHHSVFTGGMLFPPPNQQRQNTEGIACTRTLREIKSAATVRKVKAMLWLYTSWMISCWRCWRRYWCGHFWCCMPLNLITKMTSDHAGPALPSSLLLLVWPRFVRTGVRPWLAGHSLQLASGSSIIWRSWLNVSVCLRRFDFKYCICISVWDRNPSTSTSV